MWRESLSEFVLFGQSYYLRFDPKLWQAMQPYPPLGTMYAAAYLRQKGYEVALFDAMLAQSEVEWAAALDRRPPRFAVLFEDNFNYLSKMCLLRMRQAAYTMMRMARERDCTVVVCGADATDHAGEYLAQGADYVLLGEGEETLGELLDSLSGHSKQPLEEIAGLAYATATGVRSSRRPDIKELDRLPFPAWDLVDVEQYRRIWRRRHGYYSMNMVTTRGCPYHCNWCAKPIWGQRYHSRSPGNVVAELKWLKESYRPDHIWFADDIMGLKPGWWQQFAAEAVAHDARVPFKCLSRADLLLRDESEIAALRRAGCQIIWIGAESGSQKILNAMEKGTRVEQIVEAAARLQAAGVQVGFFLQFGYPGETWADIEGTLQMVRHCRPDDVGISVSYPLPGTRFYDSVKAQLGEKQNWDDSADLAMMYQGPFTTAFYRQLHVVVHKEFRSQRAWHTWRRLVARPWRIRPSHLREAVAGLYRLATLPSARRRLRQLAAVPHERVAPPVHMDPAAASRPSPQEK
jgi:anaerobic magnesium-protoporphyrin IX monomethyl ester cyclase